MTADSVMLSVFTEDSPRREWLLRCQDSDLRLGVCGVEANNGEIGIAGPGGEYFTLQHRNIVEFRTALDAAITQAVADKSS
ncbi:MAG: hypothetical protein JWQ81_2582 [Amycolatopsis sp.]|jgi:hypothetical protein|uniref:hypothetical protein n=1 Tax=Amycolatopsis sp. TaxID=37632 RepID=UPI00260E918C|nr:hypothetical protein [Amycolatopsis sp.]MCU1681843.1 hypothetical protein [Amycolatopsis sp.]